MQTDLHPVFAGIVADIKEQPGVLRRAMLNDSELAQLDRIAEQRDRDAEFHRAHPEYREPATLTDSECAAMDETIGGVVS